MKYKIMGACIIYLLSLTTKPCGSEEITGVNFYNVAHKFIKGITALYYRSLDEVPGKNSDFKIPRPDQVLLFGRLTVLDDFKDKKELKRYFEPGYSAPAESHVIAILQIGLRYGNIVKQILLTF